MQAHMRSHITDDPFCPRHGRKSRPVTIDGLRCDCSQP
jgi:hypothetical protein